MAAVPMRPPSTAAPRLVAHADFTDSHSRLHQCCCHCTSAHPYDYGDQPTPPPIPVPSLLLAAPPAPPAPGPPPATVAHVNCGGDGATAAAAAATASTTCLVASDGPPRDIRGALESIERALTSADPGQLVDCTRRIRELLSFERDGSFHDALHRSVVPHLLRFLQTVEKPELQVEALWALTNVAAGPAEHIHTLLKLGAVPVLVRLLDSPSDEVLEQAAWVLGNIACDSVSARDTVLGAGALPKVLACLQRTTRVSLLRIATWALSNLCDGQPRTHFAVSDVLPTLGALLASPDTEVLSHVCWALSHVCDGPTPHIQQVVQASLVSHLVALLSHESWRVVKPALRAIGNIVCAEDEQDYTQHVTDCGAVMRLRALIEYDNKEIQKEACWTLSNIAAGTTDQIQEVIDSGAVPPLVRLARAPLTDLDVRNEACWVLLNATSCGSDAQVVYLVQQGCVPVLVALLSDASMVMMALEGLEKVLQAGEDATQRRGSGNQHAALVDASKLHQLADHKNTAIAKRALRLCSSHFVTCALCKTSFYKQSTQTRFCPECKCHVCSSCSCYIYHLSYQTELWREVSSKEQAKRAMKQASKRNKKQRKKQKLKEKKAAQRAKKEQSPHGELQEADLGPSQPSGSERGDAGETAGVKGMLTDRSEDGTLSSSDRAAAAAAAAAATTTTTTATTTITSAVAATAATAAAAPAVAVDDDTDKEDVGDDGAEADAGAETDDTTGAAAAPDVGRRVRTIARSPTVAAVAAPCTSAPAKPPGGDPADPDRQGKRRLAGRQSREGEHSFAPAGRLEAADARPAAPAAAKRGRNRAAAQPLRAAPRRQPATTPREERQCVSASPARDTRAGGGAGRRRGGERPRAASSTVPAGVEIGCDEDMQKNDALVNFLEQTGSMIALAMRLEQED